MAARRRRHPAIVHWDQGEFNNENVVHHWCQLGFRSRSGRDTRVSRRNEDQRTQFEALSPGKSLGYLLDVRDHDAVRRVVAQIEEEVGAIDVLVNNAGYGYEGSVEEATPGAIRAQFDVNLFGAVSVLQAVLPFMRSRRTGHILNVTSMGGLMTFPGVGVYNASKFALEGINEALASEVRQFGIKVTAIEPGAFRTFDDTRKPHDQRLCVTPRTDLGVPRRAFWKAAG
jgi:NAD(P)-dependent dehydrogenase (short-subunit alcohol dehydrogenase family)